MAKLRQRMDRDGKWFLDYRDPTDGKRYRVDTGTTNYKHAQLWKQKVEDLIAQAKLGIIEEVGRIDAEVVAGRKKKEEAPTLEDLKDMDADRCEHDLELSESTITINSYAMDSFIGVVGNKKVSELTPDHVRRWKRELDREGKARSTMGIYHRHLRAIFNRAVRWKLSEFNPFNEVEVASGVKKKKDISQKDVMQLLKMIDEGNNPRFGLYVRFLLYTGGRRNELLSLRYEGINLEEMSLTIHQQKTERTLIIPINNALQRVIDKMEMKSSGFVFQTDSRSRGARQKEQPWHEDYVTHKFKKYVRDANMSEDYTLHSLRHTYATHLRKQGVPIDIVQRLLGHASSRVTEENYDHSIALHFREQANLIDFEGDEAKT